MQDFPGVAAGKIGASNAAGKECIAGNEHFERGEVEADRTLRVAGGVNDLGRIALEADDKAVSQVRVWGSGLGRLHAKPAGLRIHDL